MKEFRENSQNRQTMKRLIFVLALISTFSLGFGQKISYYSKGNKFITFSPMLSGGATKTIGGSLGFGYMIMKKTQLTLSIGGTTGYLKTVIPSVSLQYFLFNSSFNIYPITHIGYDYQWAPVKNHMFFTTIGLGTGFYNILHRLGLGFDFGYELINNGPYLEFSLQFKLGKN